MKGVFDAEALECARRCLQAGAGRGDEDRLALERAAGKYALRALGLMPGEAASPLPEPSPGPTRRHHAGHGAGEPPTARNRKAKITGHHQAAFRPASSAAKSAS